MVADHRENRGKSLYLRSSTLFRSFYPPRGDNFLPGARLTYFLSRDGLKFHAIVVAIRGKKKLIALASADPAGTRSPRGSSGTDSPRFGYRVDGNRATRFVLPNAEATTSVRTADICVATYPSMRSLFPAISIFPRVPSQWVRVFPTSAP